MFSRKIWLTEKILQFPHIAFRWELATLTVSYSVSLKGRILTFFRERHVLFLRLDEIYDIMAFFLQFFFFVKTNLMAIIFCDGEVKRHGNTFCQWRTTVWKSQKHALTIFSLSANISWNHRIYYYLNHSVTCFHEIFYKWELFFRYFTLWGPQEWWPKGATMGKTKRREPITAHLMPNN